MAAEERDGDEQKYGPHKRKSCNFLLFLLTTIITFTRRVYDIICDSIFGLFYSRIKVKHLPTVSDPLLTESAISLAEKIRSGQVTSEHVVKLFIRRIEEVDDTVNAVVCCRFEDAIKEAVAVDELISSSSFSKDDAKITKPLLGVPFTAKESISAQGMSWTKGLVARKGKAATEDAYIMKRMKDAGAILIANTNIPEFCLWTETRNFLFGQTNNPYNTNRSVGGSSGGEGCIVSCCGSPVGLGSDLGGSIRIPAYYCGVFGHKLSTGLVNTRGMLFRTGEEEDTVLCAGPITKYAADLQPSSIALVLPEKIPLLRLDEPVDIKNINYYYMEEPGDPCISPINPELKMAFLKVIRLIKESNKDENPPQEVYFSGFRKSVPLLLQAINKERIDLTSYLTDHKGRINVFFEIIKKVIGLSNYTLPALLHLISPYILSAQPPDAEITELNELRNDLLETLGDNGVLLFPSYPTVAPYHYQPYFTPFDIGYFGIFNALRLPVTQAPIGLNKDGLPMGLQIVAAPHRDKICFAVAEYIESLTGGWVPPFAS